MARDYKKEYAQRKARNAAKGLTSRGTPFKKKKARKSTKRDYHEEYVRRNQLAAERGYETYAKQRRGIETGKIPAIQSWRIRTKRTAEAQQQLKANKSEYEKQFGKVSVEQRCRDWSAGIAKYPIFKYTPRDAKRFGMTKAEYTQLYYETFVEGDMRYALVRAKKANTARLRYWLVELHHYQTAEQFEQKYEI